MTPKRRGTRDAIEIIDKLFYEGHPERIIELEQEILNAEVAHEIYQMRTKAGLTQRQLAEKVGTTASVICRLEDSDYDGHSLKMLQRIAFALGKRVEVKLKPLTDLRRRSGMKS
jgi:ribosome-binding protein aMBF1 (putative translation factor)